MSPGASCHLERHVTGSVKSSGASCHLERHVTWSVMSPSYRLCHLCVVVVLCGCWSRRSAARVNLTTSPNTLLNMPRQQTHRPRHTGHDTLATTHWLMTHRPRHTGYDTLAMTHRPRHTFYAGHSQSKQEDDIDKHEFKEDRTTRHADCTSRHFRRAVHCGA